MLPVRTIEVRKPSGCATQAGPRASRSLRAAVMVGGCEDFEIDRVESLEVASPVEYAEVVAGTGVGRPNGRPTLVGCVGFSRAHSFILSLTLNFRAPPRATGGRNVLFGGSRQKWKRPGHHVLSVRSLMGDSHFSCASFTLLIVRVARLVDGGRQSSSRSSIPASLDAFVRRSMVNSLPGCSAPMGRGSVPGATSADPLPSPRVRFRRWTTLRRGRCVFLPHRNSSLSHTCRVDAGR